MSRFRWKSAALSATCLMAWAISASAEFAAPSLSSPTNGAINQSLTPTLSWGTVTGAGTYVVNVSTASDFSGSSAFFQEGITGLSASVSAGSLANSTIYYWRVVAEDANGNNPGNFSLTNSFTTLPAAPGVPTLSSPTNNDMNQQVSGLTLSWASSAGGPVTSYAVQVGTTSSFSSTVLSMSGLTGTSQVLPTLVNNTKYYWMVSAMNADSTASSVIDSFTTAPVAAPGAPVLSSPTNNALNQAVAGLTLSWTSGTGGPVTSYAVQVGTSTSFSSTVLSMSGLTTTSEALPTLVSSTKYYWEVTATGNGTAMALDSFTTAVMPGVPTLSSPSNGVTGVATALTLSWTTATNAMTYAVQVSTGTGFSTTVFSATGLTGTSDTIGGLANLTVYYWRAGSKGLGGVSGWSGANSFTTVVAAPGGVTLSSPTNGATGQAVSLTLSWNSASNATSYTVQVSSGSDFASTVFSQASLTGTSEAVSGLASSTPYIWKVSAMSAGGTTWSSVWTFTTAVAPGAPTLSSPSNGMTGVATALTLSWTTATNAMTYAVQVSTGTGFSTTVFSATGLTGTSEAVSGLANLTVYYWRAGSKGLGGVSGWATPYSFTTINGSSVLPVAAAMKLTKTEFAVKGASLVYSLSAAGEVGITFSDLLGRTALTMNRTQAAGHYTLALKEFALAEGRYIVQFKAAGIVKRQVVCIER